MLLQDLPAKTFHHLLKSVTWTEVDALPIKNPLRRFVSRIAKSGRWVVSVRQSYHIAQARMIDRFFWIWTAVGRLRGRLWNRLHTMQDDPNPLNWRH
jgi:hypothetical protein